MVKRTALGRLGGEVAPRPLRISTPCIIIEPDDIAGPVIFLASNLAKYVTGVSLLVVNHSSVGNHRVQLVYRFSLHTNAPCYLVAVFMAGKFHTFPKL